MRPIKRESGFSCSGVKFLSRVLSGCSVTADQKRASSGADRQKFHICACSFEAIFFKDGGWRWTTGTCLYLHFCTRSKPVKRFYFRHLNCCYFNVFLLLRQFEPILKPSCHLSESYWFPSLWRGTLLEGIENLIFDSYLELNLVCQTLHLTRISCVACYATVGFGWVSSRLLFRNKNVTIKDFVYSVPFHSSWERYYSIEERTSLRFFFPFGKNICLKIWKINKR